VPMNSDESLFRSEALHEQRALEDEPVRLSEHARFAQPTIIVVLVALVGSVVIGLNRHVELFAVGPAVIDRQGTLVAAVPNTYRPLLGPGLRATFEAQSNARGTQFVTVGIDTTTSDLTIVRAVRPNGVEGEGGPEGGPQYGRALIRLGTEPILAKFVPALESILVPGL
jgi:hypothetical protein